MKDSFGLRSVTTRRPNRRSFVAGSVVLAGSSVLGARGAGAQATPGTAPVASPVGAGNNRYLFVGDRTQAAVDVYSIRGFEHTGRVDGVTFGTHAGRCSCPTVGWCSPTPPRTRSWRWR